MHASRPTRWRAWLHQSVRLTENHMRAARRDAVITIIAANVFGMLMFAAGMIRTLEVRAVLLVLAGLCITKVMLFVGRTPP